MEVTLVRQDLRNVVDRVTEAEGCISELEDTVKELWCCVYHPKLVNLSSVLRIPKTTLDATIYVSWDSRKKSKDETLRPSSRSGSAHGCQWKNSRLASSWKEPTDP